jgi:hypothetical protein
VHTPTQHTPDKHDKQKALDPKHKTRTQDAPRAGSGHQGWTDRRQRRLHTRTTARHCRPPPSHRGCSALRGGGGLAGQATSTNRHPLAYMTTLPADLGYSRRRISLERWLFSGPALGCLWPQISSELPLGQYYWIVHCKAKDSYCLSSLRQCEKEEQGHVVKLLPAVVFRRSVVGRA